MKMPPLAHESLDDRGVKLLREWIQSMPGPKVLEPPSFLPAAGNYRGTVEVKLVEKEPGAAIHYTLDGSVPTVSDPVYQAPIKLTEATTVRAKAFKKGFTRSITTQATFVVEN